MESYIEVGLDEKILKQFGYEFREKQYKKFDGRTIDDYKPIFKDGVEVTSIDIPATYKYESKKYKITSIGRGIFLSCEVLVVTINENQTTKAWL